MALADNLNMILAIGVSALSPWAMASPDHRSRRADPIAFDLSLIIV